MLHVAPLALLSLLPLPEDERVHLKDGKVLVGQVTDRKPTVIEIVVDGKKRKVARALIDRITDAAGNIRWVDAYEVSTRHYVIKTNVAKERAETLGRRLELFYAWFEATFSKDWSFHDNKRLRVECARTRQEYETEFRAHALSARMPQAFYSVGTGALYLADEALPGHDHPEQTLFHEAGHQIMILAANLDSTPQSPRYWVHEALPCTFEGLREEGGKLVQGLVHGRIRNLKIRMARGEGLRPLDELDKLTQVQMGADEYDQAYSLAWYFLTAEGGKYRKPFLRYVQDIAFTRVRPETFEKYFGRKIQDFDAEWRRFVSGLEPDPPSNAAGR